MVHLRQLLQEHNKAVAAATAAGKSADATGGLSWADVDIQTLVALDPRLLMVRSFGVVSDTCQVLWLSFILHSSMPLGHR
jgi:hypothetical protein